MNMRYQSKAMAGWAGASGINIIDNRLENPTVQQFNLGVQRQIGRDMVVRADVVHNLGTHFIIGRPVGTVFNPVVGGPDRVVNLESSVNTKYDGLLLSLEKRFSSGAHVRASYTLSKAFNYQNDGWAFSLGQEDMTFLGMMFSQPLPWPGKLRLAGEEATLRADEIRTGTVGRARLSVEGRVRRAYFDYLNAREQLALIDERSRSWREISEIARDRYAAGIGAQQDVLRAQVEVLRLDELSAVQLRQAHTTLARPTDVDPDVPGGPKYSEVEEPPRPTGAFLT